MSNTAADGLITLLYVAGFFGILCLMELGCIAFAWAIRRFNLLQD